MSIIETRIIIQELLLIAPTLTSKHCKEIIELAAERLEDLETIARFYRCEAEKNIKPLKANVIFREGK